MRCTARRHGQGNGTKPRPQPSRSHWDRGAAGAGPALPPFPFRGAKGKRRNPRLNDSSRLPQRGGARLSQQKRISPIPNPNEMTVHVVPEYGAALEQRLRF